MELEFVFGSVNVSLVAEAKEIFAKLAALDAESRISTINEIKKELHAVSPFKNEPVDCVLWIPNEKVHANDYNPNSVAPPEMELLGVSIEQDGYTQPVVTFAENGHREVVDGFHRNRVGRERKGVMERIFGFLPVVTINENRSDKADRIASTIRHNRARGKHKVEAMSDIVIELKRRNWTNERIAEQLGMDQDEILRLMQITGLADLFSDQDFSKSWDVEGHVDESDFKDLTDDITTYEPDVTEVRTVNTSDEKRIFHTYENWECHKAGFYNSTKEGWSKAQCEQAYRDFLSNPKIFGKTLGKIIVEWKHSCEHYLTNSAMNRIAWLGQAAACYALGIPASFRSGFSLLTETEQEAANKVALRYLNKWLKANGREKVTMEVAHSGDRQSDIY